MNPELLAHLMTAKDLPSGLYAGEDGSLETFATFLERINLLLREAPSPRNDIIEQIAQDMELHAELRHFCPGWTWHGNVNPVFDPVQTIYKQLFPRHLHLTQRLPALHEYIQRHTTDLDARITLMAHLARKKQEPLTIDQILDQRRRMIEEANAELAILEQDPELQRFLRLQTMIQNYQNQWNSCNEDMGLCSRGKGELLESKYAEAISQITSRGYDVQQFWTGLFWNGKKSLGEVDLLLQTDQGWVIVEFKARAHDIMAAYFQNGPHRNPEKQWLVVNGTRVVLDNSIPIYIITTLPENPFVLPMESELKRVVSYRVKHPSESIQEVFNYARTVISPDRQLPADWYVEGGFRHVIVIS